MEAIKLVNLTKNYGSHRGIKDLNLSVEEGEIFGFIGPNGAGKSTTIKTLLNFILPTAGTGEILGLDIEKDSPKIKNFIGYVPSDVRYYSDVKVSDIIKYAESFFKDIDTEYSKEICTELEIEMNKKMGELSLGNKKKVAIAQALISNPKVVILDEPTNGLDPLMQNKLFDILLREKAKGRTIFLSSHNLTEVEKFCDRVAIIKDGEIVDIINVKEANKDLGNKIVIKAKEADITSIKAIAHKVISLEDNVLTFIYKGNINSLIGELSKYTIDSLLIEEVTLEDTFLHYYKEDNK